MLNLLRRLIDNLIDSIAEIYSLFVIVVAIPFVVGLIVDYRWALLLSFVLQGVIGVLYVIRGNK